MESVYKGYTICTEAKEQDSGKWATVLSILNDDGEVVVAPLKLDTDVTFASEALAEDAGVLVAKYWIDGEEAEPEAAV